MGTRAITMESYGFGFPLAREAVDNALTRSQARDSPERGHSASCPSRTCA
jgi:hypothetical protein